MRYLILLFLLLTSCKEQKLSGKDIEFARCACEQDKRALQWVKRGNNKYIEFKCIGDGTYYSHHKDTYTEGCSK